MSCGEGRWVILLRCGDCETTRIAVAGLEAVERLDDDLEDAAREIAALADALERERVHAETEAFIDSLRRGLLNADDFREESGERADGR
jgi:hypothetical protein